jgi:hypothetical protein
MKQSFNFKFLPLNSIVRKIFLNVFDWVVDDAMNLHHKENLILMNKSLRIFLLMRSRRIYLVKNRI